jgi:hypothetical protein
MGSLKETATRNVYFREFYESFRPGKLVDRVGFDEQRACARDLRRVSLLWYKETEGEWMSPDRFNALLDAVNRSE